MERAAGDQSCPHILMHSYFCLLCDLSIELFDHKTTVVAIAFLTISSVEIMMIEFNY